jgi:hypothetical protein
LVRKLLLGLLIAWLVSVTLGLLFAAGSAGRFSLESLSLPEVVPIALLGSSIVALAVTPLVVWALVRNDRNVYRYGPMLFVIMAAYDVFVIPRAGRVAPIGLLAVGIAGLLIIALLPSRSRDRAGTRGRVGSV